jgi:hypothetical protein
MAVMPRPTTIRPHISALPGTGLNQPAVLPQTYGYQPPSSFLVDGGGLPPSSGGGSGGQSTFGGVACTALTALGFPCNAAGVTQAFQAGYSFVTGGGGGGSSFNQQSQCEPPLVINSDTGICEFPGSPGDISTPGGPSGQVNGSGSSIFGLPYFLPVTVGTIKGKPIRRCPSETVLGRDNKCYAKGAIPRKYRKWKPARKAPVTAADAAAIRKATSARARVKKLAGDVGFTCKKR